MLLFAIIYYKLNDIHFSKKMNIIDSIYYSTITQSTIGYGDIYPISNIGKCIVIIHILIFMYLIHHTFT